jgi:hypothetical protein
LRIAHCGGFHSAFDTLIQAVNLVAKLLHHPIHWDTETIGCNPSLSSIAVLDQRTLVDALQEISAWLALPQNSQEFVVLYLDDQLDLLPWVSHKLFSVPPCQSNLSRGPSLVHNLLQHMISMAHAFLCLFAYCLLLCCAYPVRQISQRGLQNHGQHACQRFCSCLTRMEHDLEARGT